jgi:hypothetical protein
VLLLHVSESELRRLLCLIITSVVFILPAWPPSASFAYTTGAHLSRLHVPAATGKAQLGNISEDKTLCCDGNTHLDTVLLR